MDEDRPLGAAGGERGAEEWLAQIMAAGAAPSDDGTAAPPKPKVARKPFVSRHKAAAKPTTAADDDSSSKLADEQKEQADDEQPPAVERIISTSNSSRRTSPPLRPAKHAALSEEKTADDDSNNAPPAASSGVSNSPPLPSRRATAALNADLNEAPLTSSSNTADSTADGEPPAHDPDAARKLFEARMLAAMEAEASNPAPMSKAAQARVAANKRVATASASVTQALAADPSPQDAMTDGAADGGSAAPTFDGPLEEKLVHKDWKLRSAAYDEMKQLIDNADGDTATIERFTPFLSKAVNDSSAPALDKAVDALISYVDKLSTNSSVPSYAAEIISGVVAKCSSAKPATKTKCDELIVLLVACGGADAVVSGLIAGTDQKNPKIPATCVEWLAKLLAEFGPGVIPYNTMQKQLPKWFDSTNAGLKKASSELSVILYEYMGDLFKVAALGLKPAAEKDLNEKCAAAQTGRQPKSTLRGKGGAAAGGKAGKGGAAAASAAAFDPLASIAAVDIVPKLSKGWAEAAVNEEKWQDRVEKLKELNALATNTPKINVTNNMFDVTAALKKTLKQTNAAVVLESVRCVAALAKSARKGYNSHAKQLFPLILPLLKEKAASFKAGLNPSLDAIYSHTLDMSEMIDTILEVLVDKVALTRQTAADFVHRCLTSEKCQQNVKAQLTPDVSKLLGAALLKTCNDADNTVREAAIAPTAALIAAVGTKSFSAEMDKFRAAEPKRAERLDKAAAAAANGASAPAASPSASTSSSASAAPATARPKSTSMRPKTAAPTATASSASASSAAPTAKAAPGKARASTAASSEPDYMPDAGLTYEDAVVALQAVVSAEHIELLASKKWTEAVDALKAIAEALTAIDAAEVDTYIQPYFYVVNKNPSWKATNVNVAKQVYETTTTIAKLSTGKINRTCAALPLADLLPKMSDRKVAEPGTTMLLAFAELTSPKFMLSQILKLTAEKNVKALEAVIQCVTRLCEEFSLGQLDVPAVLDASKQWLNNTNAAIKTAAIQVLCALYKQGGAALKGMILADVNPKQVPAIESELQKLEDAGLAGKATAQRAVKGQPAASAAAFDPLESIPRKDISGQITDTLLKKMDDAKWTERKDAIAEVNGILASAGHRIGPNDGGLTEALKNRLTDANVAVLKDAMQLVGTLAADMGKEVSRYSGKLLPALLQQITNAKTQSDALKTLELWIQHATFASTLKYLPKGLAAATARRQLCDVITAGLQRGGFAKADKQDIADLVAPLLACVQDKSKDTRDAAQAALCAIVSYVPYTTVIDGMKDFKKAEVLALQPFVDKLKDVADNAKAGKAAAPAEDSKPAAALTRAPSQKPAAAAKRPATAAPTASARSSTKSTVSSVADDTDSETPTAGNGPKWLVKADPRAKQIRIKVDAKRMRGQFREWGPDEAEEIQSLWRSTSSDDFYALLFHRDFQKQVQAIEMLTSGIKEQYDVVVGSISDLIVKWCSWRLADANTSLLQSILDLLMVLFTAIQQASQQLSDGEATILLPFLLEKVFGHNQPRFRTDARKVVKLLATIYDPKKVFASLQQGFDSKNKRVESECLEEASEFINLYGLGLVDHKKFVQQLGSQMVGSGDASVRKAALDLLATLYTNLGDRLYVMLGKGQTGAAGDVVPDKCMVMIDERLKRVKLPDNFEVDPAVAFAASQQTQAGATTARAKRSTSPHMHSTPAKQSTSNFNATTPSRPSVGSAIKRAPSNAGSRPSEVAVPPTTTYTDSYSTSASTIGSSAALPNCFTLSVGGRQIGSMPRPSMANQVNGSASAYASNQYQSSNNYTQAATSAISSPTNASQADNSLVSQMQYEMQSSPADAVLKELWTRIIQSSDRSWLQGQMNTLVYFLVEHVGASFSNAPDGSLVISHRVAAGVLNILSELYKTPELPLEVQLPTVERTINIFIPLLLDDRFRKSSDPTTHALLQQVNKWILKFITDCEPTTAIVALLQQIRAQTAIAIQQGATEQHPPTNKSLIDLLIKCKLKALRDIDLKRLQLPAVLQAIHDYYTECGVSKESTNPAEVAARKSMRTLLQSLIQFAGGDAVLRQIPASIPQDSVLVRYAQRIIEEVNGNAAADASRVSPPRAVSAPVLARPITTADPAATTSDLPAAEADKLRAILKATVDTQQTTSAFDQLYVLTQQNPRLDIYAYCTGISSSFQAHIKRTLTRMVNERGGVQTVATESAGTASIAAVARPSALDAGVTSTSNGLPPRTSLAPSTGSSVDDIRRRIQNMQIQTSANAAKPSLTPSSSTSSLISNISTTSSSSLPPQPLSASGSRVTSSTLEAIKARITSIRPMSAAVEPNSAPVVGASSSTAASSSVVQPLTAAPSTFERASSLSLPASTASQPAAVPSSVPPASAGGKLDLAAIRNRLAQVKQGTLGQPAQ